MLTAMVDLYVKATNDLSFLRDKIVILEKELMFWLQNRVTTVRGRRVVRYNVEYGGPRPESYR
jgi:alpha,alpha-trehalase